MKIAGLLKAGTLTAALLLLGAAPAPPADEQPRAPRGGAGWELVWADEFEGTALDRSKWTPEVSCWGGGNAERQCYTDRPDNIAVEGGMLLLKAKKERFAGPARPPEIAGRDNPTLVQSHTSGKVRTIGLHAWRYGRIEARAKVPAGQGTWPAIWMMPDDPAYGRWPRSGEIDILEAVNIGAKCKGCEGGKGENRTISALHFGDFPPQNRYVDNRNALPDLALPPISVSDQGAGRYALGIGPGGAGLGPLLTGLLRAMADDYGALVLIDPCVEGPGGAATIQLSLLEPRFATPRAFALSVPR